MAQVDGQGSVTFPDQVRPTGCFSDTSCSSGCVATLAAVGLCLLFIHPRAPNLIRLRSAGFINDDEGHATDDSSFQWRTKRRHVQSETLRRAGLWFVCIFGHDAEAVKSL